MSFMNLLFIRYLQKLIIQAQNDGKNSAANNYKKALNSIKKYPLPLRSGLEAKNLVGVGDLIANKLESLLQSYKNKIPILENSNIEKSNKRNNTRNASEKQKKQKIGENCDNILRERPISLMESDNNKRNNISPIKTPNKKQISDNRKEISKRKIVTPKKKNMQVEKIVNKITTNNYENISNHIKNNNRIKANKNNFNINKFINIQNNNINNNNVSLISPNTSISLLSPELRSSPQIKKRKRVIEEEGQMQSNKTSKINKGKKVASIFTPTKTHMKDKVILIMDIRENTSMKMNNKDVVEKLKSHNVECHLRTLNVGDMMWVVQKENGEEKVLNWVAERKTVCDLSHSIIDKRYKEQKYRIKKCGISNIFYIIEGNVSDWDKKGRGLCSQTLESALLNTSHGTHNYHIHNTRNMEGTISYLSDLTHMISRQYRKSLTDPLIKAVTTFSLENFNTLNDKSKNLNVKDIFGKQLMQLKGISGDKANLICSLYPTPSILHDIYESQESQKDKENLISELKSNGRRMISVSKNLFNFYN
eukprot:TRINITY_DN3923_c0_g1_i1.p1 TRINITY_DN3923_c0_g1~~TRINITY_DN3923_c0_g1_i1.p1  ORF type:complete len:535 (-),score=159.48 TRINITY_DN3923_c0_g1_i1:20-1624(-)